MASVFDSNYADFNLHWLRGRDAAYLEGATRGGVAAPTPSVLAVGPQSVQGPSGAVGAGEQWVMGVTMPALPQIAWVMVQCQPAVRYANSANEPASLYAFPIGDPTSSAYDQVPVYGGAALSSVVVTNAANLYIAVPTEPSPRSSWVPLLPTSTEDGFQALVSLEAPAGGWVGDAIRVDLIGVKYLGYPINAWQTGYLQDAWSRRGS